MYRNSHIAFIIKWDISYSHISSMWRMRLRGLRKISPFVVSFAMCSRTTAAGLVDIHVHVYTVGYE